MSSVQQETNEIKSNVILVSGLFKNKIIVFLLFKKLEAAICDFSAAK